MDKKKIENIVERYGNDPTRLMDILIEIQQEEGYIPGEAMPVIARLTGISQAWIEQTVSFYHFFRREPSGAYTVFLNNSVVANMMGRT